MTIFNLFQALKTEALKVKDWRLTSAFDFRSKLWENTKGKHYMKIFVMSVSHKLQRSSSVTSTRFHSTAFDQSLERNSSALLKTVGEMKMFRLYLEISNSIVPIRTFHQNLIRNQWNIYSTWKIGSNSLKTIGTHWNLHLRWFSQCGQIFLRRNKWQWVLLGQCMLSLHIRTRK